MVLPTLPEFLENDDLLLRKVEAPDRCHFDITRWPLLSPRGRIVARPSPRATNFTALDGLGTTWTRRSRSASMIGTVQGESAAKLTCFSLKTGWWTPPAPPPRSG